VPASILGTLDQGPDGHARWATAVGVGAHENLIHGDVERDAVGLLQNAEVNVFEGR